jgi:hypothetical protein
MINFLLPVHREKFDYAEKAKQLSIINNEIDKFHHSERIKMGVIFLIMGLQNKAMRVQHDLNKRRKYQDGCFRR